MEFSNHRRSLFAPNQTICCTSGCPDKCFFSFPQATDENQKHVPSLVIVIAAAIGTAFLLVSYYAIIIRYCSYWNITRRRSSRNQETREDYLDEGRGRVVDHPIWRIATVGLEHSIINSIPICLYKKEDGLVEGNDCSICLSEFEEDETLRLLPKCSHAFHLPCIDMWLASHTNCPLCRAPIVSISTGPDSTAENLNNSSPQVALQIETSGREEGGSSEMNGQTEEHGRGVREIVKEDVSTPKANSDFLVPMRRSISMDFIRSFALAHSVEAEGSSGVQAERGKKLKGKLSQKSPISMKRSFSSGAKVFLSGSMKRSVSSGAKVFLSRHTRDRSSILPL